MRTFIFLHSTVHTHWQHASPPPSMGILCVCRQLECWDGWEERHIVYACVSVMEGVRVHKVSILRLAVAPVVDFNYPVVQGPP